MFSFYDNTVHMMEWSHYQSLLELLSNHSCYSVTFYGNGWMVTNDKNPTRQAFSNLIEIGFFLRNPCAWDTPKKIVSGVNWVYKIHALLIYIMNSPLKFVFETYQAEMAAWILRSLVEFRSVDAYLHATFYRRKEEHLHLRHSLHISSRWTGNIWSW